ncbi:Os03g0558000, partial [Oryza sativa Japonica Group]
LGIFFFFLSWTAGTPLAPSSGWSLCRLTSASSCCYGLYGKPGCFSMAATIEIWCDCGAGLLATALPFLSFEVVFRTNCLLLLLLRLRLLRHGCALAVATTTATACCLC